MNLQEYYKQNKARFVEELSDFLRIRSISTDVSFKPEMKKATEWLKKKLTSMGMDNIKELLPSGEEFKNGNPVIYAEKIFSKDLPTLLVYGHYDVQPADPVEQWSSDPFEPVVKEDAIFARGATDNKGQVYTNIAAVEYYISHVENKRFNIKFFIEGEEEIGSEVTNRVIESHEFNEELKADYAYISDGPWMKHDTPTIEYSLRGLVYFDLHLKVADFDMHSGIYGNAVLNPANLAAYIVYKLKDIKKNRIRIPGFYKAVRKPAEEEIEQLNKVSPTWEQIMNETTARAVTKYMRKGMEFTFLTLTGLRPSFDVHGIESGYREWGNSKTIIPGSASLKFSFRLVPFQDPEVIKKQVEKYLTKIIPKGVEWELVDLHSAKPYLTDPNNPEFKKLVEAFDEGFGKKTVFAAMGGSIGLVTTLQEEYGIVSLLANYGFPDDRLHAPNEKFNLSQMEGGFASFINFASK